jgi:choline monooxygenase
MFNFDPCVTPNLFLEPQLPIHYYFDNVIYQNEINQLFNTQALNYIGHQSMVPNIGDYYSLEQDNHARILMHSKDDGIRLMSNICKHRQALILKGKGCTQNIVCPLHLWTYNQAGELISAPHFNPQPCAKLNNYPLYNWQGMLFESTNKSDDISNNISNTIANEIMNANIITQIKLAMQLSNNIYQSNTNEYIFHSRHIHNCDYNWKTFIEVYLEDYHVNAFHPGLGNFVNCDDLKWHFMENASLQCVGMRIKNQIQSESKIYQAWQEQLHKYISHNPHYSTMPTYGAIWLTYYPNIMVEFYPFTMVISIVQPLAHNKTRNIIDFYYPEDIALFEPELIAAQQAAYMETCLEDDEIAIRMDAGRYALYQKNINEKGPYQHPMEDGMKHFHIWYQKHLRAKLNLSIAIHT